MPLVEITSGKTGQKFNLDFQNEPTQQDVDEALAKIEPSEAAVPANVPRGTSLADEQQAFAARYIAEQQANPLQKAITKASNLLGIIPAVAGTLKGGVEGIGEILGEGSVAPSTIAPNLAQTGVEAGSRLLYDIANLVRQQGTKFIQDPRQAFEDSNPLISLLPRTPTSEEVSRAFERELTNRAFEEVRKQPIAEEVLGKSNIPLAEAIPLALPVPKFASVAKTIPAVEGAINISRGVEGAISGGAKMAVEKLTPKPLVENIVNALDPRSNALNPAKQVQAMKTATQSVKRILPDLTPEDLAHPQTLADNATLKLQSIHAEREALSGAPVQISLDPLADAYLKLSNDSVIRLANPRIVPQLEQRALELRGQTLSGADAERFNQYLNAENETLYSQVKTKRAQTKKANPMVAANEDAAQALRSQLDNAFGSEFGELGKDYGAWREISDLAQRQAVKQAKIEGRLSLYEGLSALQAIGSSGEPLRAALSLAGGQILKYAGSPLSRFESSSRRLASAIDKNQVPARTPVASTPRVPSPITPAVNPLQEQISAATQAQLRGLQQNPIFVNATPEIQQQIIEQIINPAP